MYKTDFIVRYRDIENELMKRFDDDNSKEQTLALAQAKEEQSHDETVDKEQSEEDDEDYNYSREDVTCICDKLYRDELLSVFDADSLEDPKLELRIKMVFEHLIKHDIFIQFLEELSTKVMDKGNVKTEQEQFNYKQNTDNLIFMTMFSHPLFYLSHQCICKMLVNGPVDAELIGELKDKLLQIFSHC